MATDTAAIPGIIEQLRATFDSGRTRPEEWRRSQLQHLRDMLAEREAEWNEALKSDLGKPGLEAFSTEVGFTLAELDFALKHLRRWMKRRPVMPTPAVMPGRTWIQPEPLGVVLNISPWNYPLQLPLGPIVGAIAAGNCAVIKPSELAPATSALLARLVPRYLDPEAVAVIQGGVLETTELLKQRFDHIFFTGGGAVGKIVMRAATEQLCPVTLELGGKSPCIVDRDVDLEVAVRRIAWGKFLNTGQTCVAPDYVLVHKSVEEAFVDKLRATIASFYGGDIQSNPDYGRIINQRHFDRLVKLLDSGEVAAGGQHDRDDLYIAPTVLRQVPADSAVMGEEIFGPILPVITMDSINAAIDFVLERPKPLALYVFSRDRLIQERVLARTSSGGACVNDAVMHLAVPGLAFGGVGPSGMGAYHGRHSFDTFSHLKSVLDHSTKVDPALRYPPYDDGKLKWTRRLL